MHVLQRIYNRLSPASTKWVGRSRQSPEPPASGASVSPAVERILPDTDRRLTPDEVERLAARIPSMGGTEIGPHLRKAAIEAPARTSIVEVGSWLGAGTAQLALGVRERERTREISIHCYDRWIATEQEVEKALRMKNMLLRPGEDTLPWVMDTLRPFGVPITFHKTDLREATWNDGPISVYVDDAAKTPPKFLHVLKTFGPHWIPGETIVVLMDFHFWEKTGSEKHKAQKRFVENHRDNFLPLDGFRVDTSDAFLYRKQIDFETLSIKSLLAS